MNYKYIFRLKFLFRDVSNTPFFVILLSLFFYLFNYQELTAQDNQRYLALVLVNIDEKDDNLGVKEIEKAHKLGFNAVNIAILWDYVKVYRAGTLNPWIQVDNQIKKASELGMKIGLRVWVDGWCGDDKSQWCSNFNDNELTFSKPYSICFTHGLGIIVQSIPPSISEGIAQFLFTRCC